MEQAGMVTTAAKASPHTLLSLGVTTPAGLLAGMNKAILQTARQTLLMTCLIACLDTAESSLTIANAGHNFRFVLRKGGDEPEMLAASGFTGTTVFDDDVTTLLATFSPP